MLAKTWFYQGHLRNMISCMYVIAKGDVDGTER